jgi:hypothetical protein
MRNGVHSSSFCRGFYWSHRFIMGDKGLSQTAIRLLKSNQPQWGLKSRVAIGFTQTIRL